MQVTKLNYNHVEPPMRFIPQDGLCSNCGVRLVGIRCWKCGALYSTRSK